MIRTVLLLLALILSLGMIQYSGINNGSNQKCANNGLNYFKAIKKDESKGFCTNSAKIKKNEANIVYSLREKIEFAKNKIIEKLVKSGCEKENIKRNLVSRKVYSCEHGIFYKVDYKHGLITSPDDLYQLAHTEHLISKIGLINRKRIFNEYNGKRRLKGNMRLKISGWEDVMEYFQDEHMDLNNNYMYFYELIGLDFVRNIKSISYPDFSAVKDDLNDYILVTYINFEDNDKKSWIIDHKLEKSK